MGFRSQDSILDGGGSDRTQLGSTETVDIGERLVGEQITYEHDAPLRRGETEAVEVVDVTALEIEVEPVDEGEGWSMDWDRALDRTDVADHCQELAMRADGGGS